MRVPYPNIKPNHVYKLDVDDGHELYIEESGDINGIPVLVLHDGPGIGSRPMGRRLFNPEKYRIIQFDQRGSGNSTPYASTSYNSIEYILNDIEKIRQLLNVEQWVVLGYGWGAALALLYAQRHSKKVLHLLCASTLLTRTQDLSWRYQQGINRIFPDYWKKFTQNIPHQENILSTYYEKLTGQDELMRMALAKSWSKWHAQIMGLQPNTGLMDTLSHPHTALCYATLSCHYWLHDSELAGDTLLSHMAPLEKVNGFIIHGRFDMLSPLDVAWQLKEHWPQAELYVIRDAGHGLQEASISDAILLATDEIAQSRTSSA